MELKKLLDVLVKRHKNKIYTYVNKKKTYTGNYLNFHSFYGMKKKKMLYHRAHKICPRELFPYEINQIKLILIESGYPQELVNNISYNVLSRTIRKIVL